MKSIALKVLLLSLIAATLLFGLASCGGTGNSTTPPPTLGSMAGSWDFTVSGGSGSHPVIVEATLTQDNKGNFSGTGSVTANGPAGSVFQADIHGSSLSAADDMAVDFLGDTCGADSGVRNLSGTIDSSNKVTLTPTFGSSSAYATISGTLTPSANPPFTATGTVTDPACNSNGQAFTLTGRLASSLTGSYAGASAANNSESITLTLTDTNGTLSGNGTDSVSGNFTATGTAVGNAFSATITPTPGIGGSIFGYFDPQLGAKGSILLISFQGGNAVSCPNGVPIDNGSCLIAILAMQ